MIDDRSVRTKDIRAFLEKDFPAEQLPTVDEARAMVGGTQGAQGIREGRATADRLAKLVAMQWRRRAELAAAQEQQRGLQQKERIVRGGARAGSRRG